MLELFKKSLVTQFDASLAMLEQCIAQCPDDGWEGQVGNHAFWHVAYHALFYIDFYLSPDEKSFEPPSFYRENYESLDSKRWPPDEAVAALVPYDKQVLLKFVELCRQKAQRIIAAETAESLAGPSGFWWYDIPRLQFYLNNLRHAQHHAAQLSLCLRRSSGIAIDWKSSG
jgi:hypothetical protein